MDDPVVAAAIVFLGVIVAILAFVVIYAFSSINRKIDHARAEGRAAVPYWHTDQGLEEERGLINREPSQRNDAT